MLRRFFRFIRTPWVLTLIGVLALSLLIWFVGPLIAVAGYKPFESQLARFGAVLLLLLLWGLNNLRTRASARKADERLSQQLIADAAPKPAAANGASENDAEQAILAERLQEALRTLQGARLTKGRKLYQLPWYVVIGSPGSGKTTALKHSGLRFPLQSQYGDSPIQGAGGTRYCDWWFTDDAVFVDTAGRYTTQDNPKESDGRAWLGFLGMLRKSRPKRPLNGVVVTVSLLDLMTKTPTQLGLQATAIKRRIQELNSHLGMELPVYVLFTKCDLVAGFNEFFADLESEEREQIWGVTLPLARADAPAAALAAFPQSFQALMERANDRVLARLHGERDGRRRSLIFEFPRQMLSLQARLDAFLKDVFVPNQFERPALLRGAYFVSGTQTAAPGQWAAGVLPTALCAPPATAAGAATPKSFFLTRLMHDVLFAEAGLASVDSKAERRFRWTYAAAVAGLGLMFVGSATAWYVSHRSNSAYMGEVHEHVVEYRERTAGGLTDRTRDWPVLAVGLDRLRALPTGYDAGPEARDIYRTFGLYQGEKVGAQARRTYLDALERYFLHAVANQMLRLLESAREDEDYLYETLRFYLMLYHPERMDREAFELWVSLIWDRALPGEANAPVRAHLMEHLRIALEHGLAPPPMDTEAVGAAREILVRTPLERRLYRRLKNEYLQEHQEAFSVEGVLGRKAEAIFYRRSGKPLSEGIPSLFTYAGFHTGFNIQSKQMAKRLADEQWIYGDEAPGTLSDEQVARIEARVHEFYFDEYIARWRALLDDLAVMSFSTTGRGQSVLRVLASVDAPLVELLEAMRKNTALSELPAGSETAAHVADVVTEQAMENEKRRLEQLIPEGAAGPSVKLPGQAVTDAFRSFNDFVVSGEGLPLHRLQQSFVMLGEYFDALAYSNDIRRAAFEASRDPEKGGGALTEVRRALASTPPVVRNWFESLSQDTGRVTAVAARGYVNDVWGSEVVSFYERAIAGRYPVDPGAAEEIRLDDFVAFFGPGGILDGYFKNYVESLVDTSRPQWRWRQPVGISNDALGLFQRARRIRNAFFDDEGKPRVEFALKPRLLDKIATRVLLETGGQEIVYQHGPVRSHAAQWPGEGGDGLARLVFSLASRGTPVSTRAEGDWGWFRLLDDHAAIRRDKNAFIVRFDVQGIGAEFELTPRSVDNPFANDDVRGFVLPRKL